MVCLLVRLSSASYWIIAWRLSTGSPSGRSRIAAHLARQMSWGMGSHGGTDVGSTTGEAVAFAVLKILRSKHYQELFLKMENNRARSAFIGWLGSYGIPYGAKQIEGLQPKRLGRYCDPKVTKRLSKQHLQSLKTVGTTNATINGTNNTYNH
jgi:hypothetical protein